MCQWGWKVEYIVVFYLNPEPCLQAHVPGTTQIIDQVTCVYRFSVTESPIRTGRCFLYSAWFCHTLACSFEHRAGLE